jgi:hypothetical protein
VASRERSSKEPDVDIEAEHQRLIDLKEELADAVRADPEDEYTQFQYREAQRQLATFRSYWRAIDMALGFGDPNFGRVTGEGRRGGEAVLTTNDDGTATLETKAEEG